MMFIGGEEGIEDLLPKISQIKSSEVWSLGKPHWWLSPYTPEEVFGLTHHHEKRAISLLINVSERVSRFDSEIPMESVEVLMQEGNFALTGNVLELAPRSAIVLAHDWM